MAHTICIPVAHLNFVHFIYSFTFSWLLCRVSCLLQLKVRAQACDGKWVVRWTLRAWKTPLTIAPFAHSLHLLEMRERTMNAFTKEINRLTTSKTNEPNVEALCTLHSYSFRWRAERWSHRYAKTLYDSPFRHCRMNMNTKYFGPCGRPYLISFLWHLNEKKMLQILCRLDIFRSLLPSLANIARVNRLLIPYYDICFVSCHIFAHVRIFLFFQLFSENLICYYVVGVFWSSFAFTSCKQTNWFQLMDHGASLVWKILRFNGLFMKRNP